ncbi:MAG TPA: hypothetical protein PKI34_13435 [Bacteroidales bacterium]|nr:hypothetical protein [Bacteroidales bacterium]
MSKDQLIEEINRYCSPDSLLIVYRLGELVRIHCPFRVRVIHSVGVCRQGQVMIVDSAKISPDLKLVYVIGGKVYYHHYFRILGKEEG